MNTVICYDLDSTLFDVSHREHLAPEGENRSAVENWIAYSKGCIADNPVEGVAESARLFSEAGHRIHIVSGRNVEAYEETVFVLNLHGIPFDEIRLHRADDLRHNGEYKAAYINQLFEHGYQPILMFEDHVEVCEIIEEQTGVPCVTVRPRYQDNIGVSFNLGQHAELTVAK